MKVFAILFITLFCFSLRAAEDPLKVLDEVERILSAERLAGITLSCEAVYKVQQNYPKHEFLHQISWSNYALNGPPTFQKSPWHNRFEPAQCFIVQRGDSFQCLDQNGRLLQGRNAEVQYLFMHDHSFVKVWPVRSRQLRYISPADFISMIPVFQPVYQRQRTSGKTGFDPVRMGERGLIDADGFANSGRRTVGYQLFPESAADVLVKYRQFPGHTQLSVSEDETSVTLSCVFKSSFDAIQISKTMPDTILEFRSGSKGGNGQSEAVLMKMIYRDHQEVAPGIFIPTRAKLTGYIESLPDNPHSEIELQILDLKKLDKFEKGFFELKVPEGYSRSP